MSDEAGLLAAVAARPDDDTPRLVYADWCDDAGLAARAAFIRAQVAAETLTENDPVRLALVEDADGLHARHGREWEPPLRTLGADAFTFRRGFVHGITISAANFLNHAEALFTNAPTLRGLKITCREDGSGNHFVMQPSCHLSKYGTAEALAEYLRQTTGRHREIYNPDELKQGIDLIDGDAMRLVASCPLLLKVDELDLSDNNFGLGDPGNTPRGATAIGNSPYLENLQRLNVSGIPTDSLALLALRGPQMKDLRILELRGCGLTTDQVSIIRLNHHCPNLEILDLRDNRIGDHYRLRDLVEDSRCPKLRTILLEGNPVGYALRRELDRYLTRKGMPAQADYLQPG